MKLLASKKQKRKLSIRKIMKKNKKEKFVNNKKC